MELSLGGFTDPKNITTDVLGICNELRPQIEDKIGQKCTTFIPLLYRSQVVSGYNYWVKILIDYVSFGKMLNECIHVKVHQPAVSRDHVLHVVLQGKTVLDEIERE